MPNITANRIAEGFQRPVFLTSPMSDDRLFVVEQHTGRIKIITAGSATALATPFLRVTPLSTANEQGLLGLAFHPKYASNGQFYTCYTDASGTTVVARYTVSASDPQIADPTSAQVIIKVAQPYANHNGGWMGFGPDGFLYLGLGDGGSGNDPGNRAQNKGALLGKILRLDIDRDEFPGDAVRNYGIPPSNPFVNQAGALPEIWSYGLRNPWRCSFDRASGDLFIGDVGQNAWEEIAVQKSGSKGGENYGWRIYEGSHPTGLDPVGPGPYVGPLFEYDHANGGVAVIGGYVYRGTTISGLAGTYFCADYSGAIWSFRYDPASNTLTELARREDELFTAGPPGDITSFGEDAAGNLYICVQSGVVYRIDADN